MRLRTVALVGLLAATSGCKAKPKHQARVSAEEARAHGEKIAAALHPCDTAKVMALIDLEAVAFQIAADKGWSRTEARGMAAGMRSTLGDGICRNMLASDVVKILAVRERDGAPTVLIRVTGLDGLNYLEFYVGRRDGKVGAFDLYDYATGQRLTESLADLISPLVGGRMKASDIARMTRILTEVDRLEANGEHAKARETLRQLPARVHRRRLMQLRDLQISMNLGDEEYREALDAYSKRFANDPSADLMSIDRFFFAKQWDEARAAINRLDKSVGGDPYLDFLRGSISLEAGDKAGALTHFERAIKREPKLDAPHWGIVTLSLGTGDHDRVASELAILDKMGAIADMPTLLADPLYADFVKSPAARDFDKR